MKKPLIGITQGDPAGIGAEIAVKALLREEIRRICRPILIGDRACVQDALRFCALTADLSLWQPPAEPAADARTISLLNLDLLPPNYRQYGRVSAEAGDCAFRYIRKAIDLALAGVLQAIVTGPINKESLHLAGYPYAGHTEIFADLTATKDYGMLLTSPSLRVIHVTTHVSMRQACDLITTERVCRTIRLAAQACRLLGIDAPRIGVAGFNVHSSENGLFGSEEADAIIPAILLARRDGLTVAGPVSPDTVFVRALAGEFDIVVAMYHDQGHIPLKLTGFKIDPETGKIGRINGVNTTVGLPVIRTSVDHGTAFDLAGRGVAHEDSLVDAIKMAVLIAERKNGGAA